MRLLLLCLLATFAVEVATTCCGGNQYECCGVGRCNVFCCNCDYGCRPEAPYYTPQSQGCYREFRGPDIPFVKRAGHVSKPSQPDGVKANDAN